MAKHLFITGMQSFVGNRLTSIARSQGWKVSGLDAASSLDPDCFDHDVTVDFRHLIPESAVVVHLAALSTDSQCSQQPELAAKVNIRGTVCALLSSEAAGASRFIFASTEWVYGRNPEEQELPEYSGPAWLGLDSLYATTKAAGEEICWGFEPCLPITILRFGIVYGPRPSNWCAFESVVQQSTTGSVSVGSASTSRRFIHVDDICRAILMAPDSASQGLTVWNTAGNESISLGAIAEASGRRLGRPIEISETSPGQASHRMPDSSKIKRDIGWSPQVGLEEGVADVLEYLGNSSNGS